MQLKRNPYIFHLLSDTFFGAKKFQNSKKVKYNYIFSIMLNLYKNSSCLLDIHKIVLTSRINCQNVILFKLNLFSDHILCNTSKRLPDYDRYRKLLDQILQNLPIIKNRARSRNRKHLF